MREIKFRIWCLNDKRMLFDTDDIANLEPTGINEAIKDVQGYDNMEIMQYTGLKDKNGKEIYEGDIVKYFDSYQVWLLAPIVYAMGCFAIKHPSWDDDILLRDFINEDMMGIEIIGNIYENPDLNE